MTPRLPVALATLFMCGLGAQVEECDGCKLFPVTHTGTYMGHQQIAHVLIQFTPGLGTDPGDCKGTFPACKATDCKYGKGVVEIYMIDGQAVLMDVYNPGGGDVNHRARIGENPNPDPMVPFQFLVVSGPIPVTINCGTRYPLLEVVVSPDGPLPLNYNIDLLCSGCPSAAPY